MLSHPLLIRGLAIIGGVAVAVLVIAIIVRATTGKSLFAGLIFSAPVREQQSIEVRFDPAEIESGGSSRISWSRGSLGSGSYSLAFSCPGGLSVKQINRDQQLCNNVIPLNPDQFFLVSADNDSGSPADVAVSILYEDRNASTGASVGGSGTFSVKSAPSKANPASGPTARSNPRPQPAPSPAPSPRPSPTPVPAPVPVNPRPDLRARIIDYGTTTADARQFFPASAIRLADTAAILFEVSNTGTAPVQSWQFEAWLPLDSATYISPVQPALPAGASARFVLGFSGLYSPGGNYTATVRVDPSNAIQESNESNNSDVIKLTVVN